MIKFITSFFYFLQYLFITKKVDVLFYYPKHFNRGKDGENLFFKPLYESCKSNNIRYLVFEEPDRKSDNIRNKEEIVKWNKENITGKFSFLIFSRISSPFISILFLT